MDRSVFSSSDDTLVTTSSLSTTTLSHTHVRCEAQ